MWVFLSSDCASCWHSGHIINRSSDSSICLLQKASVLHAGNVVYSWAASSSWEYSSVTKNHSRRACNRYLIRYDHLCGKTHLKGNLKDVMIGCWLRHACPKSSQITSGRVKYILFVWLNFTVKILFINRFTVFYIKKTRFIFYRKWFFY